MKNACCHLHKQYKVQGSSIILVSGVFLVQPLNSNGSIQGATLSSREIKEKRTCVECTLAVGQTEKIIMTENIGLNLCLLFH